MKGLPNGEKDLLRKTYLNKNKILCISIFIVINIQIEPQIKITFETLLQINLKKTNNLNVLAIKSDKTKNGINFKLITWAKILKLDNMSYKWERKFFSCSICGRINYNLFWQNTYIIKICLHVAAVIPGKDSILENLWFRHMQKRFLLVISGIALLIIANN